MLYPTLQCYILIEKADGATRLSERQCHRAATSYIRSASTCDRVSTPLTLQLSSFNVVKTTNAACNTAKRSLTATRDTHTYLLRKERVQECRRKQAKVASFGSVPSIERKGCHEVLDPGICLREGMLTDAIRGLGQQWFRKISTLCLLDLAPSNERRLLQEMISWA